MKNLIIIFGAVIIIIVLGIGAIFALKNLGQEKEAENGSSELKTTESSGPVVVSAEVEKIISEAGENLDLNNQNLEKLPTSIFANTKIKVLNLSGNRLSAIPAEIGKMVNIEQLFLQNNELASLPAEIKDMAQLTLLDLEGNNLTGIPAEIGQIKNLQILNLKSNNLDTIPNEVQNLINLKILNVQENNYNAETLDAIQVMLPQATILQ